MLNNILLIDDNPEMLSLAREEWRKYGGCITEVPTLKDAIGELNNKSYHLIAIIEDHVKDELLPIIKQMVDATDAPIIVLTSEYNRINKIASINIGADDYMLIPDSLEEIVVSGYALVRRYRSVATNCIDQKILEYAGIAMYLQERRVKAGDTEVQLTRGEFNCLRMIMSRPGITYVYETLYYASLGETARAEDVVSSVRSIFKRIRSKLGPPYSSYIKTVHGIGIKFDMKTL